jgi:hypothetical protein
MAVDAMFLSQGSGFNFLFIGNIFWTVLIFVSAYLCYKSPRNMAIVTLVTSANAGRVSRSIVDPYGVLGISVIQVHASLLVVITVLGLLVFLSVLAERHSSDERKT